MSDNIKKLKKSQVEVKIEVSKEVLEQAKKLTLEKLRKDVKVKGFRPGHAPDHVIEQNVGPQALTYYMQDYAIQRAYSDFVIKNKLQVIAAPQVKIESEEPLVFTATVAVMPEVEVKGYKSIKVKKAEAKLEKKDLEQVLNQVKLLGTTWTDVPADGRKSAKGDRVEVDFEGFDKDGKTIEGTKSKNHPINIGDGRMIPGFEDELIGLKVGDKKEFKIAFPKDYHKEDLQGAKVTFKIEIKRLEESDKPELTDELIEKATGKKQSVEEFKKETEAGLLARKEQEVQKKAEEEYLKALVKKVKVDLPDAMIDEEVNFMLEEFKNSVQSRGMEFDKFLEQSKETLDGLKSKYREDAENRVKIRLGLRHIIEAEKIEVTDADFKAELDAVKAYYPAAEHKKIEEDFKQKDVRARVENRLLLKKLFEMVLS
jgi:trigger factor